MDGKVQHIVVLLSHVNRFSSIASSLMAVSPVFRHNQDRPFVIGVCGGSASGKTTVCEILKSALTSEEISVISCDSFYKVLTPGQKEAAYANNYDFDSPNAIDFETMEGAIRKLMNWEDAIIPQYDFTTHSRTNKTELVPSRNVIIVEGILIFASKEIRDLFDLKIFVECEADIALARRLTRDIAERGRDPKGVIDMYLRFVKPSFDTWVDPVKRHSDVIIPNMGAQVSPAAMQMLIQHIRLQLKNRQAPCDAIKV
jgi:uridine kinase